MKLPRLNLNQLLVFYYVADEKSITSAAEKLCLSQPTVTSHIKSLERSTKMKLVEINKQRIILTPNGEGLYNYCKEIHSQAIAAERFVEIQTETTLNIGVSPILASVTARAISTMPDIMKPSIKLNLRCIGDPSDLLKHVLDSNIDLAIMPAINSVSYRNDRLRRIRISDGEKLIFYAYASHPLFKKDPIDWQDIAQYPLVIGRDAFLIQKILKDKLAEERVPLPLQLNLTTDSIECCKIIVQDGKSISVALLEDVQSENDIGKLKNIPLPADLWIEIDAVTNRGIIVSNIIQHFIISIKNSFNNHTQLTSHS